REQPAWRLLRNVATVRVLYGPDGASNAAFAIDQVRHALVAGIDLPESWNVSDMDEGNIDVGSITSAWYTSKFHRDSYMNNSFRSLTEAGAGQGRARARTSRDR